ncbi:MAG: bifunctional phosphoglucose/phosphomannose isomerase [Acidobacteria bacterium]|nr:bifunctional phosphoglucose/phosphomannose isomerase [Acidobacteriota bacterium]
MMDHVVELPAQLRWGIDLGVTGQATDRPVVLLGMGGSAMAATVAGLATTGSAPIIVHRSYGLPGWAEEAAAVVVAVSYSGNTEEVLSGVDAALSAHLDVSIVASGGRLAEIASERSIPIVPVPAGLQPRAGVGYQTAAVARVLEAFGSIADAIGQLAEAADVVDGLLGNGDGPAIEQGTTVAKGLDNRTTIIYGGYGVGSTAAYRWKTQLNENAKVPAYVGVVPEMNHNELEGWRGPAAARFAIVYLTDEHDHPRILRRMELSAATIPVAATATVASSGAGPIARFFSLAVVGDVASVAVAENAGTDPMPVDILEGFKTTLRKENH